MRYALTYLSAAAIAAVWAAPIAAAPSPGTPSPQAIKAAADATRAAQKINFEARNGSGVNDSRTATLADVALTPTNFNKSNASVSSTIVSLPIEKVRSNYVVDVRDANN